MTEIQSVKSIYDEKYNIFQEECYWCGKWSAMKKTGKCRYCGTENNPPLRKISFSKNKAYVIREKKSPNGFHKVKLIEEQVKEIRKFYEIEKMSVKDLAQKYNISRDMIYGIIKNKYWKHI